VVGFLELVAVNWIYGTFLNILNYTNYSFSEIYVHIFRTTCINTFNENNPHFYMCHEINDNVKIFICVMNLMTISTFYKCHKINDNVHIFICVIKLMTLSTILHVS
jgi:hypothetical protein